MRLGGFIEAVESIGAALLAGDRVLGGGAVKVIDGDTVEISAERIRLRGIDAPELDQPHGWVAKAALKAILGGREVSLRKAGTGKYGRTIADVYTRPARGGEVWVNLEMVRHGHAWVSEGSRDKWLKAAELAARTTGAGLWRQDGAIPPWEWRRGRRGAASLAGVVVRGVIGFWRKRFG